MFEGQGKLPKKERRITLPQQSNEEYNGKLALHYYNRSLEICEQLNNAAWLLRDLYQNI